MLRITITESSSEATIALDGRLAGPWVVELARCWDGLVFARSARGVRVRLDEVTFIAETGKRLLRRMHERGATLVAAGCMTRAIVEEIAAFAGGR